MVANHDIIGVKMPAGQKSEGILFYSFAKHRPIYRPNPDNVGGPMLPFEKLTAKASYLRLFTILILCRLLLSKFFLESNSGIRSLEALIELDFSRVSHRTSRSK